MKKNKRKLIASLSLCILLNTSNVSAASNYTSTNLLMREFNTFSYVRDNDFFNRFRNILNYENNYGITRTSNSTYRITEQYKNDIRYEMQKLTLGPIHSVTKDLKLPTKVGNGVIVSWDSSNRAIIDPINGKVIRPEFGQGNVKVELTATLRKGTFKATKKFIVVVKEKELNFKVYNRNLIQQEKARLNLGDLTNVTDNLVLPTKGYENVSISWKSSNNSIIDNLGHVTRPQASMGDAVVTLTATISKGNLTDIKDFIVTVKAREFTNEQLINQTLQNLNLDNNIKFIVDDLVLPRRDEKTKIDIMWRSSNINVISNSGKVTRGNKDENVRLMAIAVKGNLYKTKIFNVVVKANDNKVENSLNLISNSLKIENVNDIKEDIQLPTNVDDATIIWNSSNINIIDNTGKVRRPQIGSSDANVKLTATIIKNGKSITKEFNVTVKALKELVANNKQEFINILKDAIEKSKTKVVIKIPNYNKVDYNLDVINDICIQYPEIDYGKPSLSGQIYFNGGAERTLNLNIHYTISVDAIKREKKAVEDEVKRVIRTVIKPGMTDAQKELALHDYIVKSADYDIDNYNKHIFVTEDHNAYGILVNHVGVCESYAKAMHELLKAAGVESRYVTGFSRHNGVKGGGHAWNMVKLDGQWYNLDSTWDDPISDNKSSSNSDIVDVKHTYFNIPDNVFNRDHLRGDFELSHPQLYPNCNGVRYSFDNMNIDEVAKDGSKIVKVFNKYDLDREIANGIRNNKSKIYVKINNLNMNLNQLSNEVQVVSNKERLYNFRGWRIMQSGNYVVYTITY